MIDLADGSNISECQNEFEYNVLYIQYMLRYRVNLTRYKILFNILTSGLHFENLNLTIQQLEGKKTC